MSSSIETDNTAAPPPPPKHHHKWLQLSIYLTITFIGLIGGPLLQRLYYLHGGNRKWLMCFLQSAGFPILLIPLFPLYFRSTKSSFFMEPRLFIWGIGLGLLSGIVNYMYSAGLFYLPVSTMSLLFSTQLAFVSVFSFLLVKQRFTFYSVNAVVLLSLGAVVLALHTNSDRPEGVSKGKYFYGFFITLGAAVLSGVLLPGYELAYKTSRRRVTIVEVTQFQMVINVFGTILCTVGMLVNKDFEVIPREARKFGLGETNYYVVLVACGILWQLCAVGLIGMIHCTTSLFAGITSAALLPATEIAAVITYHETFTGEKGLSLALCLWGSASYFIGEYKKSQKKVLALIPNQNDV